MKKIISDEDLLNILSTGVERQPITSEQWHSLYQLTPVHHFLEVFNIKSGDYPIKSHILCYIYNLYNNQNMQTRQFSKQASKFITFNKGKFSINQSMFVMTDLELKLVEKKLAKKSKEQSKNYLHHYEYFLKHYNLESGEIEVSENIFYVLYVEWAKRHSKFRLTKQVFINYSKLFVNYTFTNNTYTFFINNNYKELVTTKQLNKGLAEREAEKVRKSQKIIKNKKA